MTRFRPGIWTTIITLICLVILCALGQWQLERRAWKHGLLDDIATRSGGPPVTLPAHIENPEDWRYRHVEVRGYFDHEAEIAVLSGRGYHIITPLIRPDGKDPVFVVRGFVPPARLARDSRQAGLVEGDVDVRAIARLEQAPNIFIPTNKPAAGVWYWRDLDAMAQSIGLENVVPLFLEATQTAEGGWPQGGVTRLAIPDNHLQYALTWFSLACVLLIIYLIYGFKRGQE